VRGDSYRWSVSPDSGYTWLVVEHASGQGQRLGPQFEYREQLLTPVIARRVIELGLKQGWQPSARGRKPVRLDGIESWVEFEYAGHAFSMHNPLSDYWLFVRDPGCPSDILNRVKSWFE